MSSYSRLDKTIFGSDRLLPHKNGDHILMFAMKEKNKYLRVDLSGKVWSDNIEGDKLIWAGYDVPVVRCQLHRKDGKLMALWKYQG
jgi:hypothetical protein